jgi:phosphoribosyl 1,2-cyclic phosphodiesterase
MDTVVLIDAGISTKRILEGLAKLRIGKEKVQAAFITHEHIDHIYGFKTLVKRLEHLKIFGPKGTLSMLDDGVKKKSESIELEQRIEVGEMGITAFKNSHDSSSAYGYKIDIRGEKSLVILTDSGYVTPQALRAILDADLLVLESNHCEKMLSKGRYPYSLKQRILSDKGHLSNVSCAETLSYIMRKNKKRRMIFLAHLSKDNNTYELAYQTTFDKLTEDGFKHGEDFYLVVCERDVQGAVYQI